MASETNSKILLKLNNKWKKKGHYKKSKKQQRQQQPIPTGNIRNSKYLTIKEQKFVPAPPGLFSNPGTITGIVVNNSTSPNSLPAVVAILYDGNNTVITTEHVFASITLNSYLERLFMHSILIHQDWNIF